MIIASLAYWKDLYLAKTWMTASRALVFDEHQYWRAWTTLFAHSNEHHLFSNAGLFFFFGMVLNGYFGPLVFPVMAILWGGLTNLMVLSLMPPEVHLLGSSGIVFWMGGAWLSLYFQLDIKRSLRQRALRTIGVCLALFMPSETFDPQVSYKSHLIGFLLGAAFGGIYYWKRKKEFKSAIVQIVKTEECADIQ